MKKLILLLLTFAFSFSYAQSVNDYSAVIVPLKFNFLRSENQYRLNTITKFYFTKAGFESFYAKESVPAEYNDRCSLLYADVEKESGFLVTKLFITLKDCNDKVIFKSIIGRSKDKDFQTAYTQALNEAFQSVNELNYKFNGTSNKTKTNVSQETVANNATNQTIVTESNQTAVVLNDKNLLYAQVTPTGYQLIDSTPKVVMKLMKTSQPNSFIAMKDNLQGSLILKDNQWFFEYYQNEKLVSEKLNIKF